MYGRTRDCRRCGADNAEECLVGDYWTCLFCDVALELDLEIEEGSIDDWADIDTAPGMGDIWG